MKKPSSILVYLLRALAGISLFPLTFIIGIYLITIAPIYWLLTGKNTTDYVLEKFTIKYINFIRGVKNK